VSRNEQESASFELFLDTICNTFGGVVFLAILLAIMIQTRSIVNTKQPNERTSTPNQIRAALSELESISREQQELKNAIALLPVREANNEDAQFTELAETARAAEAILSETLGRQVEKSRDLGSLLAKNKTLENENELVPEIVQAAETKVSEQEAGLQRLIASKEQAVQVARVRESGAASFLLLVSGREVYLARKPSLFGQGFNEDQVSTSVQLDSGIQIRPKVSTGWSRQSAEGKRKFREIIEDAREAGMTLTIAIWPDSYQDFDELRKEMMDANIFFQLWPQAESEILKVYLGTGGTSFVQ
jgi:hypothetical protein